MRCYCCNRILTTTEGNRRFKESGEFTEMCDTCLNEIEVDTVEGACPEDEEESYNDEDS